MPRRTDLDTIAVIGSGPIVIGQACEFDYSGTQALRVLREEGYRTVLVNSNPATIMTDPGWADRTYLEPLDTAGVRAVLERERPDALLPTLGGQTALNIASALHDDGTLDALGIELIGAGADAIRRAEDRELFAAAMASIGLRVPRSAIARTMQEARATMATGELRLPVVVRPAFTLGGAGGGFAATADQFEAVVARGLRESPIDQVLLEESIAGWGEFELEVIRDRNDNVVVVCSIENVDPMGIHTGDSATVAPAQTLSDREYQRLRDASAAVIRAIGVETGGSNVQFALNRETGELVVIEMNPRVSRSSALASKATGYPIAKVATKLAVGYTLDEIPNDITGTTPASFEPTLDYVVVKLPRFAFEKFPGADQSLTTHMKSVGEVMGIGRSFNEAWGKAMRSRELDAVPRREGTLQGAWDRFDVIAGRLEAGEDAAALARESGVHPWFLDEWALVAAAERDLRGRDAASLDAGEWRRAKGLGISDARLGELLGASEREARAARHGAGVRPVFKAVDSCAAEVEASAPYFYSTYDGEDELPAGSRRGVIILGSGPNRIGQGIEFDYCCVQAAATFRALGYDAVMVNCNPETVSTDAQSSDRLLFEPLTVEDVLEIVEREQPVGVVVQYGGQTPLRIARRLEEEGVPILGTPVAAIDLAEDRERFGQVLDRLGLRAPAWGIARDAGDAAAIAERIGYPVLVRPSYVLGGRQMRVCHDHETLMSHPIAPGSLIDRFVEDAIEVDVDAVCDGTRTAVGAVMQHVEEAGVHSGDSACVIPTMSLGDHLEAEVRRQTAVIAEALGVRGPINVQYAVHGSDVYVLEANPRASRTVPFVAKATGRGLVEAACRAALGLPIGLDGLPPEPGHVSVKAAVLPFGRFAGADATLGPEMRSTGEVMGIGPDFATAFAKAERAAGRPLPSTGRVFLSVSDRDKPAATMIGALLQSLGFELVATGGTARALRRIGVPVELVHKLGQGSPDVVELIRQGTVSLVINTPAGRGTRADGYEIRQAAIAHRIPCITTLAGASAAVQAIAQARSVAPASLQELHATAAKPGEERRAAAPA